MSESKQTEATEDEVMEATQEDAEEQTSEQPSIEDLQKQVEEANDQVLRIRAEMDNVRRRAARDSDNARKFAVTRLLEDLLPVCDSFSQANEAGRADGATLESVLEGSQLTERMLADTLKRHGVSSVAPAVGDAFNPELHEAMSIAPSEEHAADTILMVVQTGYSLNERVVRPARVIVSSGAPDVEKAD